MWQGLPALQALFFFAAELCVVSVVARSLWPLREHGTENPQENLQAIVPGPLQPKRTRGSCIISCRFSYFPPA